MKHLDLFSGIGGFALASETVWPEIEHTFCDNEPFSQEVLKKHWPNSKIYGDIRELTGETADLVTGGFPCQPFSNAGRKKGKKDDRFLWPEMLRVIKEAKPHPEHEIVVTGYGVKDGGPFGSYREWNNKHYFPRIIATWRKDEKRLGISIGANELIEEKHYDFVGQGMADCYPTLLNFNYRGIRYELSPNKLAEYLKSKVS